MHFKIFILICKIRQSANRNTVPSDNYNILKVAYLAVALTSDKMENTALKDRKGPNEETLKMLRKKIADTEAKKPPKYIRGKRLTAAINMLGELSEKMSGNASEGQQFSFEAAGSASQFLVRIDERIKDGGRRISEYEGRRIFALHSRYFPKIRGKRAHNQSQAES